MMAGETVTDAEGAHGAEALVSLERGLDVVHAGTSLDALGDDDADPLPGVVADLDHHPAQLQVSGLDYGQRVVQGRPAESGKLLKKAMKKKLRHLEKLLLKILLISLIVDFKTRLLIL